MPRRVTTAPTALGVNGAPPEIVQWFSGKTAAPISTFFPCYENELPAWWADWRARFPRAPLPPGVADDKDLREILGQ